MHDESPFPTKCDAIFNDELTRPCNDDLYGREDHRGAGGHHLQKQSVACVSQLTLCQSCCCQASAVFVLVPLPYSFVPFLCQRGLRINVPVSPISSFFFPSSSLVTQCSFSSTSIDAWRRKSTTTTKTKNPMWRLFTLPPRRHKHAESKTKFSKCGIFFSFGASFPHQGGLCILGGRGKCSVFCCFFALCVDDVHNRGHEMAPLRCSYFSSRNSSTVGGFFFCSCNFFSQRATPT